jgi:hypothetical protein
MEDASAGRAFFVSAQEELARFVGTKKRDVHLVANHSVAESLASFRPVIFKEFKTIANESPDGYHHGPGQTHEEECLKKKY